MTDEGEIGTADTMREREEGSAWRLYLLMRVNRIVVTLVLTVAVFVAFVLVVAVLYPPLENQIVTTDVIDTLFSSMITAIVTGTTIVVSVGQLVLSQENGPLGDQRARMSNTMDFRSFAGELIDGPVPADPSAFLRRLVQTTSDRAEALEEEIADNDNEQLRSEVDEFADSLRGNAHEVTSQLEGASFGTFDVLFAALNFNYGWKIFQVDRFLSEYEAELDETETDLLTELKTALSMFGPAREHVKTLYFQWALINFSQLTLYASVPALVVAGIMVVNFEVGTALGSTFGVTNAVWIVAAAFAITLVPFLLFVSYLLRILTIAKRTLAIGPLILRESQR